MKYIIRIGAFTWILADIITWLVDFRWAMLISVPIGLLLFTTFDDAESRRQVNAQTTKNIKESR